MAEYKLGSAEARFADIIWDNEPISTTELSAKAEQLLGWKKTTSYTVLKRLIDKGLFVNNNRSVSSVMSKDELYTKQSTSFVEENFGGSLPAFVAAFSRNNKLTDEEAQQLINMIDKMR